MRLQIACLRMKGDNMSGILKYGSLYILIFLGLFEGRKVYADEKIKSISTPFTQDDIKQRVKEALQSKINLSGDFDIILANPKLVLTRSDVNDQLVLIDATIDDRQLTFRIQPEIVSQNSTSNSPETGIRQKGPLPLIEGKIQPLTEIPVLTRALTPGDEILSSDITWQKIPSSRLSQTYLIREEDVLGKTPVSQVLQPGQPLSRSDLKFPLIIKKGDLVTVNYRSEGLHLTSQVQALQDGAKGDTIRFMPLNNKKEIHAKVVGPNQAEIKPFTSD